MSASWIVELFPWHNIQPRSRYGFEWKNIDMIIQHAERQGLHIVARLDFVPAWAWLRNTTEQYLEPATYADYAAYAAAFAERYRSQSIRHFIIWNEPNLRFEWGGRNPDPSAYAAFLKVIYPRIKAVVPDAVVVAGALSPGQEIKHDGQVVHMDDMRYLASLYDATAGSFFDMWAVHAYGGLSASDATPTPETVSFRRVELVRALMDRFGDTHKRIIITEGGWNDHPRWNAAVRPADRLRWTIGAYEYARFYPWIEAVCFWQFSASFATRSYPDNWNFVTPDGTPRALYLAGQQYAREGYTLE